MLAQSRQHTRIKKKGREVKEHNTFVSEAGYLYHSRAHAKQPPVIQQAYKLGERTTTAIPPLGNIHTQQLKYSKAWPHISNHALTMAKLQPVNSSKQHKAQTHARN